MQYCKVLSGGTDVDLTWPTTELLEGQCLFAEVWFGKVSPSKCRTFWLVSQWQFIIITVAITTIITFYWRIRLKTYSNTEVKVHENAEGCRQACFKVQAIVFLRGWARAHGLRGLRDPGPTVGARGPAAQNQNRAETLVVRGTVGAGCGRGYGGCWTFLRAHLPHTQRYARVGARVCVSARHGLGNNLLKYSSQVHT